MWFYERNLSATPYRDCGRLWDRLTPATMAGWALYDFEPHFAHLAEWFRHLVPGFGTWRLVSALAEWIRDLKPRFGTWRVVSGLGASFRHLARGFGT